jgi:hypothetical protein
MTTEAIKDGSASKPGETAAPVQPKPPEAPPPPAAGLAPTPPPAPDPGQRAPLPPTKKLIKLADADDIPDDADLLEMSPRALKSRLERHSKKELRDRFGTDDTDDIKAKLDKLSEFEAKAEKDRLAQLSEVEQWKERAAKAERERDEAFTRARDAQEARIVDREDTRITGLAAKYLDPDYIEESLYKLARYLRDEVDASDLKKNANGVIEDWFKKLVEKKPKLGKDFGAAGPPPKPVPLTNGTEPARPGQGGQPSGTALDKTAAPGKANSMTEAELRAYKRAQGLHW